MGCSDSSPVAVDPSAMGGTRRPVPLARRHQAYQRRMPPSVASAVFPIFKARAVRTRQSPSFGETAEGLGHAMWLIGSCEVCKPRAEADGKLVTESNLSRRVLARIPADMIGSCPFKWPANVARISRHSVVVTSDCRGAWSGACGRWPRPSWVVHHGGRHRLGVSGWGLRSATGFQPAHGGCLLGVWRGPCGHALAQARDGSGQACDAGCDGPLVEGGVPEDEAAARRW